MGRSPHDNLFLAAYDRFFQRELLLDSQVAAPARALPPAPLWAAATREKLGKKVLELRKNIAGPGAREIEAAALEPGMAELVIASALLPVREDAESLGGLFEFDRGFGIVLVAIGVVLEGALPIALPNLVFGGLPGDPQDLVVAALFAHELKTPGKPRPSGYRTVRKVRRPILL